jgi:ATP-dependent exoDNAse (exonuclease V) alpha subunit
MAIYHASIKPIKRGDGRSATAAAAYRAAEKILDRTTGQTFDYTRKRGVEHKEIVLSTQAAKADINWPRNRQDLWNAAEQAERRKDSRVAREYEIALPHEVTKQQRAELTRTYALEIANRYNVAVDFAIHKPHRAGDTRNYHAHIISTTREITPTGLGRKTDPELGEADRKKKGLSTGPEEVIYMRARWEAIANEYLHHHGYDARIDHRSLKDQGIDREPTTHLGPVVTEMLRKGKPSFVMERIREDQRREMQQRLERAAEIGRAMREAEKLDRSILDLSGNITAARQERARALDLKHSPRSSADRSMKDLDLKQQAAAERWLKRSDPNSLQNHPKRGHDHEPDPEEQKKREHTRDGPEDEIKL